ncbi:AAA family ATPase [Arcicella rigui]|uniref:AAA family ATPase n=1 Tax=Arcicella rigui TaxID=797020 RepID=A0ABU5QCN6_9BACT|nr:AAA family ATPase [Arcicella rigui]MEA5140611.1 AAA family ATPase [Arcicella rigui]
MLRKVRIQNFKSLKDVTLELQKVNLLIGPNNSGKSNFLKGLEFFTKKDKSGYNPGLIFKKNLDNILSLAFYVENDEKKKLIKYEGLAGEFGLFESEEINKNLLDSNLEETLIKNVNDLIPSNIEELKIYKPNPTIFIKPLPLASNDDLNDDCSNLITFLYTLSTNNKKAYRKLEEDFAKCVGDLIEISTPPVNTEAGGKLSLKFFDKDGEGYWADEVSEGVLYFLALLCIIHQPNPPKLLLLEEPEKGIHPRRIREVIDFIFQLVEEKDIQVIMTTHSERVLDEFEDIPESVFVFDKDEEGATQVKNLLKDIIEPSNIKMESLGLPRIKFTESLGSHWVTGFIGGVPK